MTKGMVLIALMAMMLGACSDPKQEKVTELRKRAIEVHDEVMPRMGEIMEVSGQLKKFRETVLIDSLDSTGAARLIFTERIGDLEAAHEAMMAWMSDYDPTYEVDHPVDSAIVYYEGQIGLIEEVKQAIEKSIDDGKRLVDEQR